MKNTIVQNLSRTISPNEQGSCLEVEFEMPVHVKKLHVKYEILHNGTGASIVDLGVKDPLAIRGWSGGARKEFSIEAHHATPGYLHGELPEGVWAVLLGLYKISPEGCTVNIAIEMEKSEGSWLKGDWHTHTVHSDGKFTFADVIAKAEQKGLDFIALTDHNTISQNLTYPRDTSLVFIPGMELTTHKGHSNLLGLVNPGIDFRFSTTERMNEALLNAKEKGATIVLNHPHCSNCPWEYDFEVPFDWIEVWNGPWRKENKHTLAWWHEQLCKGKRIVAVGGSDVHRPEKFIEHGTPTTHVWSGSKTMAAILDGMHKGHAFMSYDVHGPTIDLAYGQYQMGDVIPVSGESLIVKLNHLIEGDIIKIISDVDVQERRCEDGAGSKELSCKIENQMFIRVEIWRYFEVVDAVLLAAMSNPIYFETSVPKK
ncbi:CehA/McbA family metallohydrolase [Bacillus sp. T33-2]|uniref:CehA/McbA family metallohydrolase n=1 Tax=Bacillus sp. T33-2 TaxID=2054168 RepID=UPI000C75C51E|nr:CehA/McbA family metallohydrolase [Bacillus sp. T33-2]PLR95728.1 phosphoesterase [Bacillus sp. T33-2]